VRIHDQDARITPASEQAIPRIIYSTIGKKSIRRAHFDAINEFRDTNPEYKFVIFDDSEAHDYIASKFRGEKILDLFERSTFGPMRADILRVALMLFEGGVYIDISKRLKKPLMQTIPPSASFVFAHENNEIPSHYGIKTDPKVLVDHRKLIVQWCMMSCPNNPIFETMIESIERDSMEYEGKSFKNPKQAILELTATYQFTKAVWKHLTNERNVWHYAGIDFQENEYVLIKGSFSRNPLRPHYASISNKAILKKAEEDK
jgi:mannosyltransferase OCH1-like enzyme